MAEEATDALDETAAEEATLAVEEKDAPRMLDAPTSPSSSTSPEAALMLKPSNVSVESPMFSPNSTVVEALS